jgi:hypothetical protein
MDAEDGRWCRQLCTDTICRIYYKIEDGIPIKDIRDDAANGVIIGHMDEYLPSGGRIFMSPSGFVHSVCAN